MRLYQSFSSCDTIVATGRVTKDGVTLFGKNSDREPNEAQYIQRIPAAVHPSDSTVKLTYIEIPQVEHTHGVLLSRPFWLWGAEMGVNDKGVAIGNEAVFTKEPYGKEPGLIGMDVLRLALERSNSAEMAVTVITGLLQKYGQSGNCGYKHTLYYHNSFIIADPKQAFVLETSGKHWAAKQITDVYSISNGLTIENDWDTASDDLIDFAMDKGWCKKRQQFSFNQCYSDFLYTHFSDCRKRRQRTLQALKAHKGKIDVGFMMSVLRDHGGAKPGEFRPDKGLTGATVCMHASAGPIRGSQTVASLVSYLHPDHPIHFITGTAAPCTSIFKPVWIDAMPDLGPPPGEFYDQASRFWQHETLHRHMLRDMSLFKVFAKERDELENKITTEVMQKTHKPALERQELSEQLLKEADAFEEQWKKRCSQITKKQHRVLHQFAWKKWSKQAQMPTNGGEL